MSTSTLAPAGTVALAGRDVPRLGYGTMRLTGPHIMGPPADPEEAVAVLRAAVDAGVRVVDTAWYYGPDVANELLARALHPYPDDLVLVTKLGGARKPNGAWYAATRPEQLREGAEKDLRLLRVDSVPVAHLRWMPGPASFEEFLDAMLDLVADGLVERIGLSNVSLEQFETALTRTPVASVSNAYSVLDRSDEALVGRAQELGIPYLPFFPLGASPTTGARAASDERLTETSARLGVTRVQLALAWLLHRSPVMLPIPGTSSRAHLAENLAAASVTLDEDVIDALDALAPVPAS